MVITKVSFMREKGCPFEVGILIEAKTTYIIDCNGERVQQVWDYYCEEKIKVKLTIDS